MDIECRKVWCPEDCPDCEIERLRAELAEAKADRDFYRKWALELKSMITTHDVYNEFLPALDKFEEESRKANIVIGKEESEG